MAGKDLMKCYYLERMLQQPNHGKYDRCDYKHVEEDFDLMSKKNLDYRTYSHSQNIWD